MKCYPQFHVNYLLSRRNTFQLEGCSNVKSQDSSFAAARLLSIPVRSRIEAIERTTPMPICCCVQEFHLCAQQKQQTIKTSAATMER